MADHKPTYKDLNDLIQSKENLYYAAAELYDLPCLNSTLCTKEYLLAVCNEEFICPPAQG